MVGMAADGTHRSGAAPPCSRAGDPGLIVPAHAKLDGMEPVEINNGTWYLRGLRCDDRVDDRPALADLGETDLAYIEEAEDGWAADTRYTWAVCEPATGELLAEIVLDPVSGQMHSRARPGHQDAAAMSEDTVRRYAAAALGLRVQT
jgi:hypothetical protein